jgi:phage terminase large subunit-like protein
LAGDFLEEIEIRYAGTRLGRQEMDGELLTDVAGSL